MIVRLALVAALAVSGAAFAQGAPPPLPPGGIPGFPPGSPPVVVTGAVAAIDNSGITVRAQNGTETRLGVGPDLALTTSRVIDRDSIKPGDFVATTNLNQPDGTGRSTEFRLMEPGSRIGEGSRPWAQPGTTMTNATVTKVAKTPAGLEIDVAYPGGTRHIVVPPDVQVVGMTPMDPADLKVGAPVFVLAARAPDGALRAVRIMVNPAIPAPR